MVSAILYPLGLVTLLFAAAIVLLSKSRGKPALVLLCSAFAILYIFSAPLTGQILLRTLESQYPPTSEFPTDASAIVLLGGVAIPPYAPRVFPETGAAADRIFHTARLYRMGLAPHIIVSSGPTDGNSKYPSEADILVHFLTDPCGIDSSVILKDTTSVSTRDHGRGIEATLQKHGLSSRVLIVTSARHMPRAMRSLRKSGLNAIPAPTDYYAEEKLRFSLDRLLPSVDGLANSTLALYEFYALLVYWGMGEFVTGDE